MSERPSIDTLLANVRVVMMHTASPGNIGSVARALKNMGMHQLYLVAPQRYPNAEATWRASQATDILEQASVVDTLDEAIADCQFVVGTSARERSIPWPLYSAREAGHAVIKEAAASHQIALLFGREDRGLTNEELQRCHYHLHIPANPAYSALNIAQAVQIVTYEIRQAALEATNSKAVPWGSWDIKPASHAMLEHFFGHLEQTLVDMGFHDRDNPRQTMTRLRRMYNRIRPDEMEISILRGILTSTQKLAHGLPAKASKKSLSEPDGETPSSGQINS